MSKKALINRKLEGVVFRKENTEITIILMKNRILTRVAKDALDENGNNVLNNSSDNMQDQSNNANSSSNDNNKLPEKQTGDYYYNTREMVEKNKRLFNEGKIDKCRYFEFKGYKIFNPFKDEQGKEEVDPKEYYGQYYEDSSFNRVN